MSPDEFHALRRYVETRFGRIAYVERGEGPAALFVHGLPLNGYHWRHALDRLSGERRCIAPDLMGLGYTEISEDQALDLKSQAAMLLAFMDALAIERFDLVGNDSGSGVAQIMAADAPERIRSLVLTNGDTHDNFPPPALSDFHNLAAAGRFGAVLAALLENPQAGAQTMSVAFQYPERLGAEVLDVYLGPLRDNPARRARLDRYVISLDSAQTVAREAKLKAFKAPSLMVWGDGDVFFPVKWAHWLAHTLPGQCGVQVLAGAKLFFPEERPDEFLPLVSAHWRSAS